jgi:hypothetical protein
MDAGWRVRPEEAVRRSDLWVWLSANTGCDWHAICKCACMLIDLISLHPENQQDAERLLAVLVVESTDMSEQSPHMCLSRAHTEAAPEYSTGG